MSRLTRDGTAEPVSRDQILRHARGQGNIFFPVQLTTSRIGNLTRLIHTLLYVMTIHTYIHTYGSPTPSPSPFSPRPRSRPALLRSLPPPFPLPLRPRPHDRSRPRYRLRSHPQLQSRPRPGSLLPVPRIRLPPRYDALVRTPGLANGAVGCSQAPPPVCRDGDACGMRVPAVKQKRIAAEHVLLLSLPPDVGTHWSMSPTCAIPV